MDRIYHSIENAVYKVLRDHSDGTFPVSPLKIAKSMGVRVIAKSDAQDLMQCLAPDGSLENLPAFTFTFDDVRYILIDMDHGDAIYRRLLIAHELGHIVLGDGMSVDSSEVNRFVQGAFHRSLMDICCDLFALALLAPWAVLALSEIRNAGEIARVCDVHPEIAFIAAGSIRLRKADYSAEAKEAWQKFAPALQDRRNFVAQRRALPPVAAWMKTDISAELTN